jgi:hypothetical protein
MRKLLCVVSVFVIGMVISQAEASMTLVPLPQATGLDFKDWENEVNVAGGTHGTLEVGDKLRGVVQVQNTSFGLGGSIFKNLLNGNSDGQPEVTGIFEIQVLAKYKTPKGLYDIVYGPSSTFASAYGLPTNTMLALWSDDTFEFDAAIVAENGAGTPNPLNVEAVIADGSPLMALGFAVSQIDPASSTFLTLNGAGQGYWYTSGTGDAIPPFVGSAQFFYGLEALSWTGAFDPSLFVPILNTQEADLNFAWAGAYGAFPLYDFVGKGSASSNTDTNTNKVYEAASNDPAAFKVVPEPGAMLVWGVLAIFGFAAARRQCRKTS